MSKEASFDVVSKVDLAEANNAINQAQKEIDNRFDLKGTGCSIALDKEVITFKAPDEMKLRNIVEVTEGKLVKREISLKSLEYGTVEASLGGAVKQTVTLQQGLSKELAKKIVGVIKDAKLKVQAQIQDDQVRVVGKSRDDLQTVIATLKAADLDADLQFENYR